MRWTPHSPCSNSTEADTGRSKDSINAGKQFRRGCDRRTAFRTGSDAKQAGIHRYALILSNDDDTLVYLAALPDFDIIGMLIV